MITTAVRNALRVHADNISTAEPDKRIYSLHCKCVSDLSKYCVHLLGKEGAGSSKRRFPHFKLYRAVMAVGLVYYTTVVILYYVLLAINICL